MRDDDNPGDTIDRIAKAILSIMAFIALGFVALLLFALGACFLGGR